MSGCRIRRLGLVLAVFVGVALVAQQVMAYDSDTHCLIRKEAHDQYASLRPGAEWQAYTLAINTGCWHEDSEDHVFGYSGIKRTYTHFWDADKSWYDAVDELPYYQAENAFVKASGCGLDGYGLWQQAVHWYEQGEKLIAYELLGHISHLIADMSVPAHVHEDPHPLGDHYEDTLEKDSWWVMDYLSGAELNKGFLSIPGDIPFDPDYQFLKNHSQESWPLYYLMFTTNQRADCLASDDKHGDHYIPHEGYTIHDDVHNALLEFPRIIDYFEKIDIDGITELPVYDRVWGCDRCGAIGGDELTFFDYKYGKRGHHPCPSCDSDGDSYLYYAPHDNDYPSWIWAERWTMVYAVRATATLWDYWDSTVVNDRAEWTNSGGGFYGGASNWEYLNIPRGEDAEANFLGAISTPSKIYLYLLATLGEINFENPNSYTIEGPGVIKLQRSRGNARINVREGHHSIAASLSFASDVEVFTDASTSLMLAPRDADVGPGKMLKKTGAGDLVLGSGIAVGTLDVSGGRLDTGGNPVSISDTLKLGSATFSLQNAASFQVRGSDLLNNEVPREITLNGGNLRVCGVSPLLSGAIAYWPFAEVTGATTLRDRSGSPTVYDGTIVGAGTFVEGVVGKAMQFDGSGDWVELPAGFSHFDALTIAAWVYPTSLDGRRGIVSFSWDIAFEQVLAGLRFWTGPSPGGPFDPYDRYVQTFDVLGDVMDLEQWQHLAVTWRKSLGIGDLNTTIYLNGTGVAYGRLREPHDIVRTLNYIGKSKWEADALYQGLMDELYVFDRALSREDLNTLVDPPPLNNNSNTNLVVTQTSALELDSNQPVMFADLSVAPGVGLTIDGPPVCFRDVSGGDGAAISADSLAVRGMLSPGDSVGTLDIIGSLSQLDTAELRIEIEGSPESGLYDLLDVSGTAALDGELTLDFLYTPQVGDAYTFLTAGSFEGAFAELTVLGLHPSLVEYDMTGGQFAIVLQQEGWSRDGGGFYHDSANWGYWLIPNGTDAEASFLGAITGPSTVTLEGLAPTLAEINFQNTNSYTIAGPGWIRMEAVGGNEINVLEGNHTIAVPLHCVTDLVVDTWDNTRLTLKPYSTTPLPPPSLIKRGGGSLVVVGPNPIAGTLLDLNGGELVLAAATADTDLTFENPVAVHDDSALTAGSGGGAGAAGPLTLILGGPDKGITLQNDSTLRLRTTDDYTLNVAGTISGSGKLNVTEGTVMLSASGSALDHLAVSGGRLDTGGNAVSIFQTLKLRNATFSLQDADSFQVRGSDLVNNEVPREITLTGGNLRVCGVSPLLSGAIAYWSFDEATGATTLPDRSGSPTVYDGTIVGPGTFVEGVVGNAMQFDGANDWVQLPEGFSHFSGLTIGVWLHPTAVNAWERIIDFSNGPGEDEICLARREETDDLRFAIDDGEQVFEPGSGWYGDPYIESSDVIESGQWQHLAVTWSESGRAEATIYKNGEKVASGSLWKPGDVLRTLNYIGKSPYQNDGLYQGLMDELYVFDRLLFSQEIQDLAHPVALHNTNIVVTKTCSLELDSNQPVMFADLSVAPGVGLTIDGPPVCFRDVNGGDGAVISAASLAVRGMLSPGNSVGTLDIIGSLSQLDTAELYIEIEGSPESGLCDLLDVSGTAALDGKLTLEFLYTPQVGDAYTFLTAGDFEGAFAELTVLGLDPGLVAYDMTGGQFAIVPEPGMLLLLSIGAGTLLLGRGLIRRNHGNRGIR